MKADEGDKKEANANTFSKEKGFTEKDNRAIQDNIRKGDIFLLAQVFFFLKRKSVKKGLVTAILVISALVMFTAVASASAGDPPCTCGDICVNETGWWQDGGAFNASGTPIQDAVNNAHGGETICVKDGMYTENVDVNVANLTIISENGSTSCIVQAASTSDHVFEVTADYVNITGFTVKGATSYKKAGIYLDGVEHCYISDNKASNNDDGIYLDSSSNNNLTRNTASNNDEGIYLWWSSNNNLTNNTVSNNNYGIYLCASSSNNLTGNTFVNDGLFLSSGYHNTVENNTVNGKPLVYLEDTSDYMVPDAGQVILAKCNNVTVENQDLSNTTVGVELWETTNSTITNNTVSNNNYGIYLSSSSNNNTLTNNTANSNNGDGIHLSSSSNNNLTNNTANSNNDYGIYLSSSSNNTLNNNTMCGNTYNFGVYSGSLSGYTQNIDTSNTVDGKPVYYWINQQDKQIPDDAGYVGVVNSTNITVKDLTLTHNGKGVLFVYTTNSNIENVSASNNYYGIYLESSSNNNLSGNTANSNNHDGIYLKSSSNYNTLTSNTVSNTRYGILVDSSNNTLTNNTASNNGFGIWLYYSSNNNTLTSNNASNNNNGIYLYSSSNTLTNNTANSNNGCGIYLADSSNTLTSNTVSSNDYGIWLSSSINNTLTNNTANSNNDCGIYLQSSINNTLTNNTVSSNGFGIGLYSSNSNLIYNNYFNNTNNADDNGNNIWNITKTAGTNIIGGAYIGGNYWSDYAGEDLNSDGLGDSLLPYNSSGKITNGGDCLPLVQVSASSVFDTGEGTYPSIMGTHEGKIIPACEIRVSKMYTYPCAGTGGHIKSIELYENGVLKASGTWNGYQHDWHNITITPSITLKEGHEYRYVIETGSYPQIIHAHEYKDAIGGTITCDKFTDVNGKIYTDWIPAIRLE